MKVENLLTFLALTQIDEMRYMTGLKWHFTLEDMQAHIQRCLADPTRYDFAICLNHHDEMIGKL
ncbi:MULTISPECIES: hypothetical protein [Acinetobacter]|uniref:hypothetical protein n=1 Tax=Acinetobacter TaxID=469 RepID=UPI000C2498DA|nr:MULTISPECIES: hypothetical protein [Acinetobacter]MEE1123105.1 hypothetical protein [Acinetobacter pseudolwoffii]PJI29179.1 hypothetical protein CU478_10525 [Acinetobacter pseudolwoffii]